MAFSLSNWFKGKPPEPGSETEDSQPAPEHVAPPTAPHPLPASVRTVTPNNGGSQVQKPVSLRDPSARPPLTLPTAKLPTSGKATPVMPSTRKVSMGANAPAPAPAAPFESDQPAFKPTAPDVTVSLEIGDFLDRLPPSFLNGDAVDRHRKVDFEASELYSDLAKGRASVPASVIYRRCPEIFSRPISDTEDVEVALPLQKLVEQMGMSLSTRADQLEEENVGEIETPFLQVAMEDNARVPTAAGSTSGAFRPPAGLAAAAFRPGHSPAPETNGEVPPARTQRPGHISTISPVKMLSEQPPVSIAPPTAATSGPIINGKRPPSTVRASVAGGKIRLSGPAAISRVTAVPAQDSQSNGDAPGTHSQAISLPVQPTSPSHQVSKKTARIQIPPISLRSGGPNAAPRPGAVPPPPAFPVPPPPNPGAEPTPVLRGNMAKKTSSPVTFRTSPPPPAAKAVPHTFAPPRTPAFPPPAFPVAPPPVPASAAPAPAPADDRKIELGLSAILRGLPSTMLTVEPSSIPDDVRISLPFALIEPQLSQGRVAIRRDIFVEALPEAHRQIFSGDDTPADIQIPLQEVFQNLPANALTMRVDQVKDEPGSLYPTPFSQKAEEDAQRFATSTVAPPPTPAPEPDTIAPIAQLPDAPAVEAVTDAAPDRLPVAPSAEVELPVDATPTLDRDIPLDLEGGSTVETPAAVPALPAESSEKEQPADVALVPEVPAAVDAPTPEPVSHAEETPEPAKPAELVAESSVEAPAATLGAVLPPLAVKHEEPTPEAVPAVPVSAQTKEKRITPSVPAPAHDSVLQTLFMTEEELDAKTIVKLVCQLPSITGCAVMFEDGLRLAGNFPDGDTQGFSAMAAPFFKRASRFVSELELGSLQTFSLHTENDLFSFLMHDNICVSVRHTGRGFMPGVREKLEVVTRELARMYATAKPRHDAD